MKQNNTSLSMDSIAEIWLNEKSNYVKQSTMAIYDMHIRNHILPYFNNTDDLTEDNIQEFIFYCANKGLSAKTIKDGMVILKMIAKKAAKLGAVIITDWEVNIPRNRDNEKPIDTLSHSEQRAIVKYMQNNFSFKNLAIMLALHTGMRIGEICALQWRDFDKQEGVIHVNRTVERIYDCRNHSSKVQFSTPKTIKSRREIPIPSTLRQVLNPLSKFFPSDVFLASGSTVPLEPRSLRAHFYQICHTLGMRQLKFHILRHTFATRCISAGCDVKTVSVLLGHSSVSTTMELYVHPNLELKKKVIEKAYKII